jgi:hypothetical protein
MTSNSFAEDRDRQDTTATGQVANSVAGEQFVL